jgi:IAA-amino acid hydrolase
LYRNKLNSSIVDYIGGDNGRAGNVIPESVKFGGTFRSLTNEGISCLQKKD